MPRPSYPWKQGEELFAEELNAAIANSGAYGPFVPIHTNSPANVMDFGADPTGVADSTAAIQAAVATGHDVWLPAGTYRLTDAITIQAGPTSRRLSGSGDGTVITIDMDFNPTAQGVFVLSSTTPTYAMPNVAIDGLRIRFVQPVDIQTTAAAAAAIGATTIAVASSTGIAIGQCAVDFTRYDALSNAHSATHPVAQMITVTGIAGNVVSLSGPVASPGVTSGDTLYFGMTRATMAAPGTGTTVPGGTGVRYPWAIYAPNIKTLRLKGIYIEGAWNGVYLRGESPIWEDVFVGAMNIGLDIDNCSDFGHIDIYKFFAYGLGSNSPTDLGWGRIQSWYDGATVAANVGKLDGMTIDALQSFVGMVNITPNFTYGQIGALALDGVNANLNITSTSSGWLEIANFYRTVGAGMSSSPSINMAPTGNMQLHIANLSIAHGSAGPAINVSGGGLHVASGLIWHDGLTALVLGGDNHSFGPMRFDGVPRTRTYISHIAGGLQLAGAYWVQPGANQPAIAITDNVRNVIGKNSYNNWGIPSITALANPLGVYADWSQSNTSNVYSATQQAISRIIAPNGALKLVRIHTGGGGAAALRWEFGAYNDSESGANAGSTFYVRNFSDTGTQIAVTAPLLIDRPTGKVALGQGVAVSGGATPSTIDNAVIGGTVPSAGWFTSITLNASGPTIRAGTGAATGTQPKGSLWMRTDGAAGSTLYVSQGAGTWLPVAGV